MGTAEQIPPGVTALRNLILGVAKNFVGKVYGADGPERGARVRDVEELAVEIGRVIPARGSPRRRAGAAAGPVPAAAPVLLKGACKPSRDRAGRSAAVWKYSSVARTIGK